MLKLLTPTRTGVVRKMVTGRYYGTPAGTVGTVTPTLNLMSLTPLWVPHAVPIDRIGIEATSGVATSVTRLGIYDSDANDLPNARVGDYGTVDCSTTGAKELTISQVLAAGLYWMAGVQQTAASQTRGLTGSTIPVAATTLLGSTGSFINNCYTVSGVSGALPATAAGFTVGTAPIRIQVRAA